MKNLIAAILISLFVSFPAYAGETLTIDTSTMTAEQVAAIKTQIEQSKSTVEKVAQSAAKVSEHLSTVDVNTWTDKAENAADAIVSFTAKLGIAAKEFLMSPTGLFVVVLGSFYFFG